MDDKTVTSLTIGVPCALFVFFALSVAASNAFFKYSERKCKWVQRQCRFLDAISLDIQRVNYSVEQIRKRANQIGGSELNNLEGITQPLRGIDLPWVHKAQNVSRSAKLVVEDFESLSATRRLVNRFLADFINLLPTIDNAISMKRAAREIDDHVKNKQELAGKMFELLQQTRERVRSLQDRPIGRTANEFLGSKIPFKPAVAFALERLTGLGQNSIRGKLAEELRLAVIKVKLVEALVKDLLFVRLESEIEKAWAKEALEVVKDAEHSIFAASEEEERTVRWPVTFGFRNMMARRRIGRRIGYFDRQYSDLLEAKDRYGIRFLRRETKRHVRRRLQRATGGRDVASILAGIRRELPQWSAGLQLHRRVTLLCEDLESLERVLKEEKAEEGAIYARAACFELLKKTAMEAEKCVRDRAWQTGLVVSEIDQIHAAVDLLQRMVKVCSIKVMKDSCSAVGFDEDVHGLVSALVAVSAGGDEPTVVSIVGTEGIGKTTLAKEVLNHISVYTHFQTRLVTFCDGESDSDEARLLESVGKMILQTQHGSGDEEFWVGEIQGVLKKRACLVVLDNLPSKKAWDTLKQVFSGESKAVVMVTTASWELAEHVNPSGNRTRTHRIRLRTEAESWKFFTQMVKFPSNADEKTKSLAKRVVARTGGLPLAILHLGYLLSGKDLKEEELTRVLDREHFAREQWSKTWKINKEDFQSKPILSKCFSYSEFFPADFDIPSRRLLALWVASGSVHCSEAADCLQELVGRNMIQVVERKRNGEVKTCRFPSTLRDIWLRDTRNKAARARSWSLFANFNRQLAYRFDHDAGAARSVHGLNSNVVSQEEKYPRLIMFFDTRDGNKPNEDIGSFLLKGIASSHRRFQDLMVLDLEGVFRPHLPGSIGKLKKLTYLGLRWTFLETLPDSIGELSQLQTLDLKHTYVQTLPRSTWKLKTLRHLYLSENCRIKHMPQLCSGSLKELRTLSGMFLDHEGSALSNGLDKLQSLQKLGVTISQLPPSQEKGLGKGIAMLTQLRSLSLRSISETGEPQGLRLKTLSSLKKLTNLYLLGKLKNKSVLRDLPESLTELTLSASELSEDPTPMLAKLPGLKFLSLLSNAYTGTRMVCQEEDFQGLLVLQIWSLPNLENLEVKPGAMPKLREFEIRNCKKLRITDGLTNLKTLQELKLTNMADQEQVIENEFAAAKENSSEKIIHCPSITKNMRKLLQREA